MGKSNSCIEALSTAIRWVPVIVVFAIYTWSLYAYTFPLAVISMESTIQKILCLIVFYILLAFSVWSYVQTIYAPYGKIPSKFFISPEISEQLALAPSEEARNDILNRVAIKNDLPITCRTYSGGIRYCEKCNLIKPDRCHHCSLCRICILRMDHHCPWVNNCVSFTNHKFFVLFLGYTFLLCAFVGSTSFVYFLKFWSIPDMSSPQHNYTNKNIANKSNIVDSQQVEPLDFYTSHRSLRNQVPFEVKFHILFLFFLSVMLGLGVVCLYCYHIYLVLKNQSTLESFRPPLMTYGPDRNAFNLGRNENVKQIFGPSKSLWFLPLFTSEGTGLVFNQRQHGGPGHEEACQELLSDPRNAARTRNQDTIV